jgi:hypothetical protein
VRRRCFLGRAIEIRHVSRRDGDDPKGGVIAVSDTSTPLQSKRRCAPRPFAQTATLQTQQATWSSRSMSPFSARQRASRLLASD